MQVSIELLPEIVLNFFKKRKNKEKPYCIHVGGASGSGKTTLSNLLLKKLNLLECKIFSMDSYMKGKSFVEMQLKKNANSFGWDDIENFDLDTISEDLDSLNKGVKIYQPIFDRKTTERSHLKNELYCNFGGVLIVEGVQALNYTVCTKADLLIFTECSFHERLWRRAVRSLCDPEYGGGSLDRLVINYIEKVEPSYNLHVLLNRNLADIIVDNPNISPNKVPWNFKKIETPKELNSNSFGYPLTPRTDFGFKKSWESLVVHYSGDQIFLEYSLENIPIIFQKISKVCLNLLSKYYIVSRK